MELEIDFARFRFEPDGDHVREVYYGSLFILIQHYSDPTCAWEQQQALNVAASVLRHSWDRLSPISGYTGSGSDRRQARRGGRD